MFWIGKRVLRIYRVPPELATAWDTVIRDHGFDVNYEKRWALKATEFSGYPWGEVTDDHANHVGMGAVNDSNKKWASPPGLCIHVAFKARDPVLAGKIGAILEAHGAVLATVESKRY
jgi:hypothetical protein